MKSDDGTESEVTEWVRTNSLTPDEILANFRDSYFPRSAVAVDMISTGADVKAIACVFFMRNVKSAGFFEQMQGRGARVITPDKLKVVTPGARAKERFVIVAAVGVCEQDRTDSHTLNRKPSATLQELLEYVGQGVPTRTPLQARSISACCPAPSESVAVKHVEPHEHAVPGVRNAVENDQCFGASPPGASPICLRASMNPGNRSDPLING